MNFSQEQFEKMRQALATIAATPLWGEPVTDEQLRKEHTENGQYNDEDGYQPSADDESTMLRDAVELARGALGLPINIDMPFICKGCGREESICSAAPCPAVIADREGLVDNA